MRFRDKAALISGGASGIGRATARLFAKEGARVAVGDVDEPGLDDVVASIERDGGKALALKLDVTVEDDWERAVATLLDETGSIDVFVACAGIAHSKPVTETSLDEWRRVHATNLDGVFLGAKHTIGAMRGGRGGSIVIVSSISGIAPSAGASAYCSSKAALRMFARTCALECASNGGGIRVNTVSPGAVRIPMWESTAVWE